MKKAKAQHVAKPAKPAKPPRPAVQQLQHQVAVLQRQVASLKHPSRATAKHTHHGKKAASKKHAVKRGWSPDEDVALCSARAFAESLRLSGLGAVSDSAVLDVYWATAADADSGASIVATAEAILASGLGSHKPVALQGFCLRLEEANRQFVLAHGGPFGSGDDVCARSEDVLQSARWALPGELAHGLILGLALPEPHAVAVAPDGGWWSWGEPYSPADFPGAVIEEAWAVTWQ